MSNAKRSTVETFDEMKLKARLYKIHRPTDTYVTGVITQFENSFPIHRVKLDEFERRIKRLADSSTGNDITEEQLIEVLSTHKYMKDIGEDGIIRALLMNPCL
jgi:hypothetical protein